MGNDIIKDKQPLIKNRDFVIISIQPWYYELGSNCKNIALELAKHNRVLYINIPITRKTFYNKNESSGVKKHCKIIRTKEKQIEQIGDQLWQFYPTSLIESINWIPFTSAFSFANRLNNRRFASDIKKAIEELGFNNIILFNDNDIYNGFYLKELLSPSLYIYYMRDFLQGYSFWKKHSSILEPKLIKKADIVVTNSLYYRDYCMQFNPESTYIGQGCKLSLFDPEKINVIPGDLQQISRPRIGYVGALDSSRLDHKIIQIIAEQNSKWQIVLVGPEDETFRISELHKFPNIHFLGSKTIDQLPSYIKEFDVCINPQKINFITNGNYPLKIDEYLAMGKSTVATKTKAMELFAPYVLLAEKPEDYPYLIEQLLANDGKEATIQSRISFAQSHTWENSIKALYETISKYLYTY